MERPGQLAGARVECAHVARRVVPVHQAIADAAAEDHEILVDDRRRRVRVVLLVDRPEQAFANIDDAVVAERLDRLSGFRVEADQAIAAVQEDAQLVAVAPRGDSAMDEPLSARRPGRLRRLSDRRPTARGPTSASSATTRLYGVLRYSTSSIMIGVISNAPGRCRDPAARARRCATSTRSAATARSRD